MKPGGGLGRGSTAAATMMVCLGVLLGAGCAARSGGSARAGVVPSGEGRPEPSLESQIARTRALSAEARPKSGGFALTVETWDPKLSSALAMAALSRTADAQVLVAAEYRRLGILDVAYAHLTKAVGLDDRNAAAHEGLARIWRDWGFPQLGLADAEKAVRLAPASPSAANTLGTLLAAAGKLDAARRWYERSLTLDPGAPYALNNLCYTSIMQRRADAVDTCERATVADPGSQVVRNNLALAYAARGDLERARSTFEPAGQAASSYNMGMVYLGQGRYRKAIAAFQQASRVNPHVTVAAARARQSEALLARHGDTDGDDD
jgi:tetratricopeptide (TPR) repeat protein